MQTKIAVRHGQLNDATRDFITGKCDKLVHLFERVTEILVTVEFEHAGDRVRVEMLVDAEHKHDFTAHCEGTEVTPTFESCLHKMERQLRRYKKRIQEHHGDPSARQVAGNPFDEEDDEGDEDDDVGLPPAASEAELSAPPGGVAQPPSES
ncbi:ribosome hibernation-promoting factor, HPF/YfiA family [Alienimonas sp. DA493]|uniref:ribosome hibernation-promoting factor, HPF/YfiA family n=1 Tax=Alienimonas sp. DA493 TaxID=3373605 RepID=UPI0037542CA2